MLAPALSKSTTSVFPVSAATINGEYPSCTCVMTDICSTKVWGVVNYCVNMSLVTARPAGLSAAHMPLTLPVCHTPGGFLLELH